MIFHETNRATTNPGFAFEKKEDESAVLQFQRITVAVYFMYFESIIVYRSTHRAGRLSQRLKHSGVLSHYVGHVDTIPTYRVYRL